MKEEPVLVRQLELERRLKARSDRLFIAKPKSARFFCLRSRDPQNFAGNPGITHQAELLAGREIVEVDLGMRSIGGYGVCADAQGERHYGHSGKAGRFVQQAESEAHILE